MTRYWLVYRTYTHKEHGQFSAYFAKCGSLEEAIEIMHQNENKYPDSQFSILEQLETDDGEYIDDWSNFSDYV